MAINVSNNNPRVVYTVGATPQTDFVIPFDFFDTGDVNVYVDGSLQTHGSDYTMSGADADESPIVFTTAVSNCEVAITRDVPLERTTDFTSTVGASAMNDQLDRIVAQIADIDDKASRSLQLDDYEVAADLTIPSKDSRKGYTLAFNSSTGNPEVGPSVSNVINADTYAANASASATAAAASESAAAASETAAAASETAAAASETAAATSETNAATSETNAATSEANAATSETNAATSETNAATSETNAATSETNAATSAANAATSETNAATSETNAASSATAAAASQTAAASSAAAAASSYDTFDDRYLGSKTSDPTLDNDNNALVQGALYFNSTANEMRVYDGANWIAASSAGGASLLNYNYTATAGQTTFSGSDDNAASLSYTQDNLIVTLNGIVLEDGTDYTANNGTSIVLASGAAAGDELNIVAFKSFTTADMVPASTGGTFSGNVAFNGDLTVDTNTLYVDSTNNRVGVGTTSPAYKIEINAADTSNTIGSSTASIHIDNTDASALGRVSEIVFDVGGANLPLAAVSGVYEGYSGGTDGYLAFSTSTTSVLSERMRIDSSGNLLVGTTSANPHTGTSEGVQIGNDRVNVSRSGGPTVELNRANNNGDIAVFRKDGTTVGSIATYATSRISVGSGSCCLAFLAASNQIIPSSGTANSDNTIDLGSSSVRFDDIYATNGTIQTSDVNEKQQIAELTAAEMDAAKAISKLFKTFKWNDSVAEKGDAARTHSGVIAQDVEQAMTDAGLDAGDYAFFISTTWWETQTEVPAVEADEENGVEAQEAYTRTDTYDTAEEAPEGATERTRKGIRYPQLLSFIGAATEQRLASIEARLDALEVN